MENRNGDDVLMTTLGLQKVSPEVVEAGQMSGCTRWQMLRHVYIPAARTEILVGVNQVIMLCLAMVVLTAFIGMPGLGAKLLAMMGSFKLGRSFEIGITIVLLAVTLDRLSKAWVVKLPEHFERGTPWWVRHKYLVVGIAAFVGFTILAQFVAWFSEIGRTQTWSKGKEMDTAIKTFLAYDSVQATLYSVLAAVAIAVLLGLPIAILAARSDAWSRRVLLVCDTAQTFPSFIYLIPAIMLLMSNCPWRCQRWLLVSTKRSCSPSSW